MYELRLPAFVGSNLKSAIEFTRGRSYNKCAVGKVAILTDCGIGYWVLGLSSLGCGHHFPINFFFLTSFGYANTLHHLDDDGHMKNKNKFKPNVKKLYCHRSGTSTTQEK